jgi:NodT family efflux transporter outer membrane factor (OMF) lipoprotein
MKAIFLSVSSILVLSVAGCTTPNPKALDRPGDVPVAFTAPIAQQAPVWPATDWWTNFKSPELPALEETAKAENLDLAAAAARVVQAAANAGVSAADLYPQIGLDASAQRQGSKRTTFGNGSTALPAGTHNNFNATLQASYQLDFWGEEQDRLRQANQTLRAQRYAEQVTAITIESDVADAYLNILALREQITLAKQNIAAAKRILAITQAKVTNGVLSNLDLSQQQVTLASQEVRLPGLIEQEREARYALAILLGRAPEGFDVKGQNLDGIVSPVVAPGLPSELLARRPDVVEAEAQLYAAHANVDAARAAFFPAIGLTGQGGYASDMISNLINPSNLAWSIGASLVQTVFDGGRLHAQSELAEAQQTELIANYRKTVFSAFSDAESALGQVDSNNQQLGYATTEEKAAAEAFRISELQYREGITDLLTVLQAQQALFTAQDSLVSTKLARLQADVSLYRALGGGWTQQISDETYKSPLDWWPI